MGKFFDIILFLEVTTMSDGRNGNIQFDASEFDGRKSLGAWKCYCIVFIASFLCYANTLGAKFVYDDK